ncbi:MAG: type II toxin-antitoxin system RelE/ParE family toxin [Gammaproteobacteria bacterium]|nr:type II toxin-antitoxin system RelE/ParE family toxin [Gammaproteobacteria bacterium]
MDDEKPLYWVGSSLDDLRRFPDEVKDLMGYALQIAQWGDKHPDAKPLKGFKGASTLEVVEDHDGDTYRAVYTVQFKDAVYVLHAFQKKSKQGIKTPKPDMDLIKSRLKAAQLQYLSSKNR